MVSRRKQKGLTMAVLLSKRGGSRKEMRLEWLGGVR